MLYSITAVGTPVYDLHLKIWGVTPLEQSPDQGCQHYCCSSVYVGSVFFFLFNVHSIFKAERGFAISKNRLFFKFPCDNIVLATQYFTKGSVFLKCPNCEIEILGSMKKCPRCAYDIKTGQIDLHYLDSISKAREQNHTAPLHQVTKGKGIFSQNGENTVACDIALIDKTTLKISKSKEQKTGRKLTRIGFGLVGTLVYDAVHDEAPGDLFVVNLDDIQRVWSVQLEQNVHFPQSGMIFYMSNRSYFLLTMDNEFENGIKILLGQRWIERPHNPIKFRCKVCGNGLTGWYSVCPSCGKTNTIVKI